MSRVVLAMSGGVDSSVAAHLLLEAGHEVIGVFMRHGEQSPVDGVAVDGVPVKCAINDKAAVTTRPIVTKRADHKQGCCSASDAADGRRVADSLGIPFYAINLEQEFSRIIDYFVDEYTAGRTPNPCVACNNWLKFGKLFDYADGVGAQFVATGHYAQLVSLRDGSLAIRRGVDLGKDQSYVLFGVERAKLSRMLLPVGGYEKPQIREMAAQLGLRVAEKKDSQEICFVTSGKHDEFIRERRPDVDMSGDIVTADGRIVGTHPGIERFTIGQRKGIGVAMGEPHFVVEIQADTHRVVIGPKSALARNELTAGRLNWLAAAVPEEPFRCHAQIRYNSSAEPATAEPLSDGRLRIEFDQPCHGVAPGQAVVCYDDDRVLGGGWIE